MAPWDGGSELGGGDEGCVSDGGGKGRGVKGADGGASGGGTVDFGEGGEGVPAEKASAGIPMRVTVLMQRAGGAAGAGGVDAMGRGGLETGGCGGERGMSGAQSTQSAPYAHIGNSEPGLSQ